MYRNYRSQYYAEQRRVSHGPRNLPCPDCHEPNRMTQGEINKGYHCSTCTREIEGHHPESSGEYGGGDY